MKTFTTKATIDVDTFNMALKGSGLPELEGVRQGTRYVVVSYVADAETVRTWKQRWKEIKLVIIEESEALTCVEVMFHHYMSLIDEDINRFLANRLDDEDGDVIQRDLDSIADPANHGVPDSYRVVFN